MQEFPSTIIYRHKKENKKKCTLQPLIYKDSFDFINYPSSNLPPLNNYCVLSLDGPVLTKDDSHLGIVLIDGTWKYAEKMFNFVMQGQDLPKRSLPSHYQTAYPRKQTSCTDPMRGLASIEALYIAYFILNRPYNKLLDAYHWKELFLTLNKEALS